MYTVSTYFVLNKYLSNEISKIHAFLHMTFYIFVNDFLKQFLVDTLIIFLKLYFTFIKRKMYRF